MHISRKTHTSARNIHNVFCNDAYPAREFIGCHIHFSNQQFTLFKPRAIRFIHFAIKRDFYCCRTVIDRCNHHAATLTSKHPSRGNDSGNQLILALNDLDQRLFDKMVDLIAIGIEQVPR